MHDFEVALQTCPFSSHSSQILVRYQTAEYMGPQKLKIRYSNCGQLFCFLKDEIKQTLLDGPDCVHYKVKLAIWP